MNMNTLPIIDGNLYDYRAAMRADVEEWIDDNGGIAELVKEHGDADKIEQYLNDELFCDDGITGNGSGSYWFSSYRAQIALIGNYDLIIEAGEEFGGISKEERYNPESLDVIIRCYLLGEVISGWIEDNREEIEQAAAEQE